MQHVGCSRNSGASRGGGRAVTTVAILLNAASTVGRGRVRACVRTGASTCACECNRVRTRALVHRYGRNRRDIPPLSPLRQRGGAFRLRVSFAVSAAVGICMRLAGARVAPPDFLLEAAQYGQPAYRQHGSAR